LSQLLRRYTEFWDSKGIYSDGPFASFLNVTITPTKVINHYKPVAVKGTVQMGIQPVVAGCCSWLFWAVSEVNAMQNAK